MLRELQRGAVDRIKRHALGMSLRSPRAQAHILTEYLWVEECSEAPALQRMSVSGAPPWVGKLIGHQLADEQRHAELLRGRLAELGARTRPPPDLARVKLWWLERGVAPFLGAFAEGPVVVLLAVVAQLEATGVRIFARHLAVLEASGLAGDRTTEIVRAILTDEQRHARSCAAGAERLVRVEEWAAFEALRRRVARIDRAFGVTLALGYWVVIAALAARDRVGIAALAARDRVGTVRASEAAVRRSRDRVVRTSERDRAAEPEVA